MAHKFSIGDLVYHIWCDRVIGIIVKAETGHYCVRYLSRTNWDPLEYYFCSLGYENMHEKIG